MKRSGRLAHRSKKRARHAQSVAPEMTRFHLDHFRCWNCLESPTQLHHIAGKRGRPDEFDHRANWGAFCGTCHELFTDNLWLPTDGTTDRKRFGVLTALAFKFLRDREFYDLGLVLRVWGKRCISEADVFTRARELGHGTTERSRI